MNNLEGANIIFFALFAIVLVAMYIITRRGLAPVAQVTLIGTVINVVLVALIALGAGNGPLQVIFVGLVVGVIFSVASVAIAAYFRGSEISPAAAKQAMLAAQEAAASVEPQQEE